MAGLRGTGERCKVVPTKHYNKGNKMAKHGKNNDAAETRGNPVIRALNSLKKTPDPDRLAKDVEIIDKGWNNTAEGQADLATGGKSRNKSKAKHKR